MDLPATQAIDDDDAFSQQFGAKEKEELVGTLEINSTSYPIVTGTTMIGRHPDCGIQLDHETLSKKHAEIEADTIEKPVFIRDLNSSNKTKINNSKLKPNLSYQIKDNDKLTFGKVTATFKIQRVIEDSFISSTPQMNRNVRQIIPGTPDSLNASDNDVSAIPGTQNDETNFRRPQIPTRLSNINSQFGSPRLITFSPNDLPSPLLKVKDKIEDISDLETQKVPISGLTISDSDDNIYSAATQKVDASIKSNNLAENIFEMETQRPSNEADIQDDIENLETQRCNTEKSDSIRETHTSIYRAETPPKETLENLETQQFEKRKSTLNDSNEESIYTASTQKRISDESNKNSIENLETQKLDLDKSSHRKSNDVSIYSAETQKFDLNNSKSDKRFSSNDVSIHSALTQKIVCEIPHDELIENLETQRFCNEKSLSTSRRSDNQSIYSAETQINNQTISEVPIADSVENLETQKCQVEPVQFQTPTILKRRSANKSLLGTASKKVTFDKTIDESLEDIETQQFLADKSASDSSNIDLQLEISSTSLNKSVSDKSLEDIETQRFSEKSSNDSQMKIFEKICEDVKKKMETPKFDNDKSETVTPPVKRLSLRLSSQKIELQKKLTITTSKESIADLETQQFERGNLIDVKLQNEIANKSLEDVETQEFISDKNINLPNKSNLGTPASTKKLSLQKAAQAKTKTLLSKSAFNESIDDLETQKFNDKNLSSSVNVIDGVAEKSIENIETQQFTSSKNHEIVKSNLHTPVSVKRLSLNRSSKQIKTPLSKVKPDESIDDMETQPVDNEDLKKIINESMEKTECQKLINQSLKLESSLLVTVENMETMPYVVEKLPINEIVDNPSDISLESEIRSETEYELKKTNNLVTKDLSLDAKSLSTNENNTSNVKKTNDVKIPEILTSNNDKISNNSEDKNDDEDEEMFCSQNLIEDCPFSYLDENDIEGADQLDIASKTYETEGNNVHEKNCNEVSVTIANKSTFRGQENLSEKADDSATDEEGLFSDNLNKEERKSSNIENDSETDEEGVFSNSLPDDEIIKSSQENSTLNDSKIIPENVGTNNLLEKNKLEVADRNLNSCHLLKSKGFSGFRKDEIDNDHLSVDHRIPQPDKSTPVRPLCNKATNEKIKKSNSYIVSESDSDEDVFSGDKRLYENNRSNTGNNPFDDKNSSLKNQSICETHEKIKLNESVTKMDIQKSRKLSLVNKNIIECNEATDNEVPSLKTDVRKSKRSSFTRQSTFETKPEGTPNKPLIKNDDRRSKKKSLGNQSISESDRQDISELDQQNKVFELDIKTDVRKSKRLSLINQSLFKEDPEIKLNKSNLEVDAQNSKKSCLANESILEACQQRELKVDARKSKRLSLVNQKTLKTVDEDQNNESMNTRKSRKLVLENKNILETDSNNDDDSLIEPNSSNVLDKSGNQESDSKTDENVFMASKTKSNTCDKLYKEKLTNNQDKLKDSLPKNDVSNEPSSSDETDTLPVTETLAPTQLMESEQESEVIENIRDEELIQPSKIIHETELKKSSKSPKRMIDGTEDVSIKKIKGDAESRVPKLKFNESSVESNLQEMFEETAEVTTLKEDPALLTQQLANILESSQSEEFSTSVSNLSITSPTLSSKRSSLKIKKRRSTLHNTINSPLSREKTQSVNLDDTIERNLNELFTNAVVNNETNYESDQLMTQQLTSILSSQDDNQLEKPSIVSIKQLKSSKPANLNASNSKHQNENDDSLQLNQNQIKNTLIESSPNEEMQHQEVSLDNFKTNNKSSVLDKSKLEKDGRNEDSDKEIVYKRGTIGFTEHDLMPIPGDESSTTTTTTTSRMSGLTIIRNKRSSVLKEPPNQPIRHSKAVAGDEHFGLQKLSVVISPLADKLNKMTRKRSNMNLNFEQFPVTPTAVVDKNITSVTRVLTGNRIESPDAINSSDLEDKSIKVSSKPCSEIEKTKVDSATLNSANSSKENIVEDSDTESKPQSTTGRGRRALKYRNISKENEDEKLNDNCPTDDCVDSQTKRPRRNLRNYDPAIKSANSKTAIIEDSDSDEKIVSEQKNEPLTNVDASEIKKSKEDILIEDSAKIDAFKSIRNKRGKNSEESQELKAKSTTNTRNRRGRIIPDSDKEESQESQDSINKSTRNRRGKLAANSENQDSQISQDSSNKITRNRRGKLIADSEKEDLQEFQDNSNQSTRNRRGKLNTDSEKEESQESQESSNKSKRNRRDKLVTDSEKEESQESQDDSSKNTRSQRIKATDNLDVKELQETQSRTNIKRQGRTTKNSYYESLQESEMIQNKESKELDSTSAESTCSVTGSKTKNKMGKKLTLKRPENDVISVKATRSTRARTISESSQEFVQIATKVLKTSSISKQTEEVDSEKLEKSNNTVSKTTRSTRVRNVSESSQESSVKMNTKNTKKTKPLDSEKPEKFDENVSVKATRSTRTRTISESSQVSTDEKTSKQSKKANLKKSKKPDDDVTCKTTRCTRTRTDSESSQVSSLKISTRGTRNTQTTESNFNESQKPTAAMKSTNKRTKNSNSESSQESVDVPSRNKRFKKSDLKQSQELEIKLPKIDAKHKINSQELKNTENIKKNKGRKARDQSPDSMIEEINVPVNLTSVKNNVRQTRKRGANSEFSAESSQEESQEGKNLESEGKNSQRTVRRGRAAAKKNPSDSESKDDDTFEKPASRAKRTKVEKKAKDELVVQSDEEKAQILEHSVSQSLETLSRSSRRSLSSPLKGGQYKILFTGEKSENHRKIVKKLGGTEVNDLSKCSILITDKFVRTFKFLCALSKGIPIVSTTWLENSSKANHFLDWEDYLLKDPIAEEKYKFNLEESLNKSRRHKFLQGFTILLPSRSQPPASELKEMVTFSGGKALLKAPSKWPSNTIVVTKEENLDNAKKLIAKAPKSVSIHSIEFILTGILRQDVNLEEFKISA